MILSVLLKGHYANPDLSRETRNLYDLMQSPEQFVDNHPVKKKPARKARRLPADDAIDLCKKYQKGSTVEELASEFSVHRTTVMNHLERNGIKRRVSKPKMTEKMIVEALELRESGWDCPVFG